MYNMETRIWLKIDKYNLQNTFEIWLKNNLRIQSAGLPICSSRHPQKAVLR